eukprot:gene32709-3593_t
MQASSNPRTSEADFTDEEVAPFVRFDQYGAWGLKPQPRSERIRLWLMSLTLFPLRITLALFLIAACFFTTRLGYLFSDSIGDQVYLFVTPFLSRTVLWCVGFRITWVRADDGPHAPKPAALVSNHVSWSDIIIHMSDSFPSFVARDGTQNLPIVGFLSQKLGCMYVKRAKDVKGDSSTSSQSPGLSSLITERMERRAAKPNNEDRPLLLFPEGRFYPSWDTVDFKRQVFLLFCQPTSKVTCYELPVYVPSEEEKKYAALFASNVRDYMFLLPVQLKFGNMKPSESTFPLKMSYMVVTKPK